MKGCARRKRLSRSKLVNSINLTTNQCEAMMLSKFINIKYKLLVKFFKVKDFKNKLNILLRFTASKRIFEVVFIT